MAKRIFIVGAKDMSMDSCELLFKLTGEEFMRATYNGRRVYSKNTYNMQADTIDVSGYDDVIFIECNVPIIGNPINIINIGHQKSWEFGYGKPHENFWEASSLGQIWDMVVRGESTPKNRYKYVASTEYLSWAYKDKCPGVRSDFLLERRIRTKAAYKHKTEDFIKNDIRRASKVLDNIIKHGNNVLSMGGESVLDLRGGFVLCNKCRQIIHSGCEVSPPEDSSCLHDKRIIVYEFPELIESSAKNSIPILIRKIEQDGVETKFHISSSDGRGAADLLSKWNLQDTYGDPVRGMVGGYI
jgi:hypothetical protein